MILINLSQEKHEKIDCPSFFVNRNEVFYERGIKKLPLNGNMLSNKRVFIIIIISVHFHCGK